MKNNFFELTQNNSGGSFVVDKELCHRLIIEAIDEKEALSIAESMGCYWNGVEEGSDCPCCGDRWYPSANEINLDEYNKKGLVKFENIEQYCQFMADEYGWTKPDVRIFYKDGTVKEIFSRKLK